MRRTSLFSLFLTFVTNICLSEEERVALRRGSGRRGKTEPCNFGSLPGTMLPTGNVTEPYSWHIYEEKCRLKPLLVQYLQHNAGGEHSANNASFLLIGDSVDHRITKSFVNLAASSVEDIVAKSGYSVHTLQGQTAVVTPSMDMVYRFIPGVSPHGPYHNDFDKEQTPAILVPEAFQVYTSITGKARPDAVVMNALFWDVGRLTDLNGQKNWTIKDGKRSPPRNITSKTVLLPLAIIAEWMKDTEALMRTIEEAWQRSSMGGKGPSDLIQDLAGEETVLIYHNAAFPRTLNCQHSAFLAHPGLGFQSFIQQLNAAARQIAKKEKRWHFVDFGHMSEAFTKDEYLADSLHPKEWFLGIVLNVILNIFNEYRR